MDSGGGGGYPQSLMQQCKQEAKHLLEANVTNRKIHWSHPSFISFCTSVDDVLSFEVHKKYKTINTTTKQWLTSSGRVLQELAKTFPVAESIYNMCYTKTPQNSSRKPKADYSNLQSHSRVEYKILWIRTAILEKTLKAIVEEILRKPERFYSEKSILCHSVYGELFSFLLDGPCSLNLSRMKSVDTSLSSPAPSEIINRYSRVLPTSSLGYTTYQQEYLSSEVWSHIQSLYQTTLTTCLFGKNNILIKPPDVSHSLEGYLTLVQIDDSLMLKWLPNSLINRNYDDTSFEKFIHILSLDITNDIAHIHCHQGPGVNESEINLIGYNGIAYPALSFPHPLSLIHFLEALENGLHPKGCLEPPLWYLRQSHMSPGKQNHSLTSVKRQFNGVGKSGAAFLVNEEGFPVTWNQVFRVRFSRQKPHHRDNIEELAEWDEGYENAESSPDRLVPINHEDIQTAFMRSRSRSPNLPNSISLISSSKRKRITSSSGLEHLQGKVSHQLLARYFYSWLSYCRHISRVKTSLSHLIIEPSVSIAAIRQEQQGASGLNQSTWKDFLSARNDETWAKAVWQVYNGGISSEHLRREVWPYLLKVFPFDATTKEIEEIVERGNEDYQNTIEAWKELEQKHYHNNDPTSTSLDIRLGVMTSHAGTRKTNPIVIHSMEVITEEGPDLIELDSKVDEEEEEELMIETAFTVDGSDGDIDSGCEDRPHTGMSSEGEGISQQQQHPLVHHPPPNITTATLSPHEEKFLEELLKIDKDIPRCDRDYRYFQVSENLSKLRNIITSYIWKNVDTGYSQGMCDLLAPLLVTFNDEKLSFICFEKLMETMENYFPPKTGVQERMNNLRSLLQILESDFFQYLSELPMGDSLFYSYRWFLVNFKREFSYEDIFLLWETCWAATWCTTMHFEVFVAMAIIQQYKKAIMDAQLDASEILNLFTDLSEKKALKCAKTVSYAQSVVSHIFQDSHAEN